MQAAKVVVRKCIFSGQILPKHQLYRIGRIDQRFVFATSHGRGYYVQQTIWKQTDSLTLFKKLKKLFKNQITLAQVQIWKGEDDGQETSGCKKTSTC